MGLVLGARAQDVATGTGVGASVEAIVNVIILQGQAHQQHKSNEVFRHFLRFFFCSGMEL